MGLNQPLVRFIVILNLHWQHHVLIEMSCFLVKCIIFPNPRLRNHLHRSWCWDIYIPEAEDSALDFDDSQIDLASFNQPFKGKNKGSFVGTPFGTSGSSLRGK